MEQGTEKFRDSENKKFADDRLGRKANKKNLIVVISLFLVLFIAGAIILGYIYLGKSHYEKGTAYTKDKKFTEAIYEFQKVSPESKDFSNAQSKINYINGLEAFNEGRKADAMVYLSKVKADDEYYHDAQLMMGKLNEANIGNDLQSQIDSLKKSKDTVIVKKEITVNHEKKKDPIDPGIAADLEITRKYVSDAGSSVSQFESVYQTARSAPLNTKGDYGKTMESIDKNFNNLKYSAQNKDAGAVELKRMISEWMNKRIAFIRRLITDKTVTETDQSRPLKEEGDRLYTAMMNQMKKVKAKI